MLPPPLVSRACQVPGPLGRQCWARGRPCTLARHLASCVLTHKSGWLLKSIRDFANTTIRRLSALISPEAKVWDGGAGVTCCDWTARAPEPGMGSSDPNQGREVATRLGHPGSWLTQHTPGLPHVLLPVLTGRCPAPAGRGCGLRAGQVWTYDPRLGCCPGDGQLACHLASQRLVIRASSLG